MKKLGKMSLIFEFFISKLGYTEIFLKICGKRSFTHFLGHFWLVEAKIKIKIKKHGKLVWLLNSLY